MEEEPEFSVRLSQRVDDRPQTSEMSEELEHSQDLQNPHQSEDLADPADDLVVLQALQYEGDVEGEEYEQVYQVHRLFEEPPFVG